MIWPALKKKTLNKGKGMEKNLTNKEMVRLINHQAIEVDAETSNALVILCDHLEMTPGDLVHDLIFSSLTGEGLLPSQS